MGFVFMSLTFFLRRSPTFNFLGFGNPFNQGGQVAEGANSQTLGTDNVKNEEAVVQSPSN